MKQGREPEVVDAEVVEVEDALAARPEDDALAPAPEPAGPMTVGDLVDGASNALGAVGTTARRWIDRGRYRKVRISRKGKQVLPDIPVAALAAVQAASLYGAGFARVLAVNVGARFLFDVEVVNEADKYFAVGVERFLEGDLERAEEALLKAVRIDDTHAQAYLQLGVLYRMRGEVDKAKAVLERARRLDDAGEVGKKAGDILRALAGR
jgi:tetratricopeptide (TPR) repeat protein